MAFQSRKLAAKITNLTPKMPLGLQITFICVDGHGTSKLKRSIKGIIEQKNSPDAFPTVIAVVYTIPKPSKAFGSLLTGSQNLFQEILTLMCQSNSAPSVFFYGGETDTH